VIATQDVIILGRRSYTEWAQFWPSSDIEPFATFINGVAKYVATSTPLDRDWANATAIDGGLLEFIQELKRQPGGDIGVHGSISVAQALLAADLVDEIRLVIGPMIAGRGRRLLDGLPSKQLESIQSEPSSRPRLNSRKRRPQSEGDHVVELVGSPARWVYPPNRSPWINRRVGIGGGYAEWLAGGKHEFHGARPNVVSGNRTPCVSCS
jgi:dihydrofolate reductase